MRGRCLKAAALAFVFAAALAACGASAVEPGWREVTISLAPQAIVVPAGRSPPPLPSGFTYRGAVRLQSADAGFGGISDAHVFGDGRLLAITDRGDWIQARLTLDAETGLPTAIASARMARMTDARAIPLARKEEADAEDLALLPDGRVAVSFEHTQSIRIYDIFGQGPMAPATPGPVLSGTERLRPNRGLEAMTALPDGRLVVAAELGPRARAAPVWLADPMVAVPVAPITTVRPQLSYAVTALERLPNGDFITLERQYLPNGVVRAILVAWPAAAIGAPAREVARHYLGYVSNVMGPAGNYEGVSALPLPDGAVRLYLFTDDNFAEDSHTLISVVDWSPTPLSP